MSAKAKKSPAKAKKKATSGIECCECKKHIKAKEQALFVEENVGRYFCDESCIVSHFTPVIAKMEREYSKHVSPTDLSSEERERFSHLRWSNIEKPDEVWREQAVSGDEYFTMISEYQPEAKPVWGVAVCLMLRGEPSFLFIAFVTSDRHLVDNFRKGEALKVIHHPEETENSTEQQNENQPMLGEPWTEADSIRANIIRNRSENDIPVEDFAFYQKCMEETLQEPTELWSYAPKTAKKVYHFIREYTHDSNYWYVVMAKDTTDETQIEIVDAFPTKDKNLIELCRHGSKEVLGSANDPASAFEAPVKRTVH